MASLPQQPSEAAHKSLQINIDSEEDAKAVIQHLQAIKVRWDILHESGLVDSIEFCIAAPIRRLVDADLMGAVRWCRTWLKSVAPFEGNVHYALPHYAPGPARPVRGAVPITFAKPVTEPSATSVTPPEITIIPPSVEPKQHGKSKRPVSADAVGA